MSAGDLAAFIEGISNARDIATLEEQVHLIREKLGAAHLIYHWVNANGELFGAGTYDTAWREHYISENFQRVDPVVRAAYQRFHPVHWGGLEWDAKPARRLFEDAKSAKIGNQGVTIPIRGPNGQFAHFTATLTSDAETWADFSTRNGRNLILLGHFFNQKALELRELGETQPDITLSGREIDALTFLAMGYSRAQAADTLAISEHTLRVYIESARAKLGGANTTHAVARALQSGLLAF